MYKHWIYYSIILISLYSCSKDPGPVYETPTPPNVNITNGLFVMNEGNFQWNNASVSFVNLNENSIQNDIYNAVNHELLGDVAQSITIIGNKAYLVVNNSHNIVVVSVADFIGVTKITGFNSPRYLLPVNANKAYVSDLYQHGIYVLNLQTNTIQKTIPASGWTERMLMANGKAFITNMGKANVLVVDTSTDIVIDSIPTVKEPNSIVKDNQGKLWVLCSGGTGHEQIPALLKINPVNLQIESQIQFTATDYPTELCINTYGNELYYINGGIYKMSIASATMPINPIIPSNGRIFYRLALQPNTDNVFVTDAVDYTQDGWVLQYNNSGMLLHSWRAGRIPGNMAFVN
jgi:YVTN family beta-propeller protein